MAELPAIPLFVDALIGDTHHLSDEEFGRYIRIMALMWSTPGCSIPDDQEWICRKLRIQPLDYGHKIKPLIEEFCYIEKKRIFQKRLLKEYTYVFEVREKKRQGGQNRHLSDKQGNLLQDSCRSPSAPTPTPTPTLKIKNKNGQIPVEMFRVPIEKIRMSQAQLTNVMTEFKIEHSKSQFTQAEWEKRFWDFVR